MSDIKFNTREQAIYLIGQFVGRDRDRFFIRDFVKAEIRYGFGDPKVNKEILKIVDPINHP